MKRIEYRNVHDRTGWPRGPWDTEPDKLQWPDAKTGLPCLAVRGPFGNWCGYVGVPPGHRLHGSIRPEDVHPHGGVTFTAPCSPDHAGVCHVPDPGEPDDVWWIGFDAQDYAPGMVAGMRSVMPQLPAFLCSGTYRNLKYVRRKCAALAQELV